MFSNPYAPRLRLGYLIGLRASRCAGPTSSKPEQVIVGSCPRYAPSWVKPLRYGGSWLRRGLNTWHGPSLQVKRDQNELAIQFLQHVLPSSDVLKPGVRSG